MAQKTTTLQCDSCCVRVEVTVEPDYQPDQWNKAARKFSDSIHNVLGGLDCPCGGTLKPQDE